MWRKGVVFVLVGVSAMTVAELSMRWNHAGSVALVLGFATGWSLRLLEPEKP